jgi:hypothetical protein
MMGVGVTEYAQNLTDYVNDLGMSLDSVNESFMTIADMANRASFGTRRFYSMVVQATSGQSSLNVRLDQTAELLLRMTKILGQKKAAELVSSHSADLAGMGAAERTKMALIAGGKAGRRAGIEARTQATSFAVTASKQADGLARALKTAHLGQDIGSAISAAAAAGLSGRNPGETARTSDELVKLLREMPQQQQASFIAALQADPATAEMGRQMSQLIDLSRASSGRLGDVVNGFGAFSSGGSIAMKLDTVQRLLGRLENVTSAEGRMAAENILGLSGAQYDTMREVSRVTAGQFSNLRDAIGREGVESREVQMQMAEQYGAAISHGQVVAARVVKDATGQNQVQLGNRIEEANDLIAGYMERSGVDLSNIRDEQKQVAWDTYNETVSIGDLLENKILYYIRGIYEDVGLPIIKALAKWMDIGGTQEARDSASGAIKLLTDQITTTMSDVSTTQRKLALTGTQLGSQTDPTKIAELSAQKKELEAKLSQGQSAIEQMREARSRLAQGDYTALKKTEFVASSYDPTESVGGRMRMNKSRVGSYATREQAQAALSGMSGSVEAVSRTLTPQEIVQSMMGATQTPTSVPTAQVAASSGGAPPVAITPSRADLNPPQTAAVTTAVSTASETTATAIKSTAVEQRKEAEARQRAGQQNLAKIQTRWQSV